MRGYSAAQRSAEQENALIIKQGTLRTKISYRTPIHLQTLLRWHTLALTVAPVCHCEDIAANIVANMFEVVQSQAYVASVLMQEHYRVLLLKIFGS